MFTYRRIALLFTTLAAGLQGCSAEVVGPTPALSGVDPSLACTEQLVTKISLSGADLSPLAIDSATDDPHLALPSITLRRTQDVTGAAVSGAPVTLPNDPENPRAAHVRWTSAQSMEFDIYPELKLEPGVYEITVSNPNGRSVTKLAALAAVARPTITSVEPDPVCTAQSDRSLTVSGTGFVKLGSLLPTLDIGGSIFQPSSAADCVAISGAPVAVELCTSLTVDVPQNGLAPGTYEVTLTNPQPAACASTDPVTLEVKPPPELTSVAPGSVCLGGGGLDLRGLHFENGMTVTVGGLGASNVHVASPTQATATLGAGLALGGPYPVTVTNPSGCSSTLAATVTVSPGPLLVFVDPPVVWNGANTPVNVYATGVTGSVTKVQIVLTGSGNVPTDLSFTPTPGRADRPKAVVPVGTPPGAYDVMLTDALGCPAVLSGALRVTDTTTLSLTGVLPSFGWTGSSTSVAISASTTPPSAGFGSLPTVYLTSATLSTPVILSSVARISATALTADVPAGLPSGAYDVVVVNQDGSVGVLPGGFTVTANPPPSVSAIAPPQVPNTSAAQAIVIRGANFRAAASARPQVVLRCRNPVGTLLADQTATVGSFTSTSINASINATTYPNGANCVVVVTNTDDGSRTEFSSLVVVTPQQNLTNFIAGPMMITGRKGLGTVSGEASQQSRFIYAIAGDDGANTLKTVETLPVDIFGLPGAAFFAQRRELNTPRTRAGAVRIGRFIYAIGGTSTVNAAAAALNTVERAAILDQTFHPGDLNVDLNLSPTDGLGAGVYYYRVAAVMPANDAFNPGGETLPSSPFGLSLPALTGRRLRVTLSWTPVPGAVGYRIYRSNADGTPDSAGLIADTSAALPSTVTCSSSTTCTDLGAAPDLATTVLPLGSTGTWTTLLQTMGVARQAPGVTFALDPVLPNRAYIYVFGGLNPAGTALPSYELLPIQINLDGSQTPEAFTPGIAALTAARWRLGAYTATPDDTPRMNGGTYVWAGGGASAAGAMVANFDGGQVTTGGQLASLTNVGPMNPQAAGYGVFAAGDFLYALGGQDGMPDVNNMSVEHSGTPPGLINFQGFTPGLTMPRIDLGAAEQSGYFYVLGGLTTGGMVTKSIEYVLY